MEQQRSPAIPFSGRMTMLKADKAVVNWEPAKKQWVIRLQSGEEVIKRPAPKTPRDATDDVLRSLAVTTAQDEGYELDASSVTVAR
jgi:hypothetical protein